MALEEMYQNVSQTCTAITVLVKAFVYTNQFPLLSYMFNVVSFNTDIFPSPFPANNASNAA